MTISVGLRFDILQRDNFTCRYCGKQAHETELEVDHIHPVSRGGSDHPSNLVATCWKCNRGKGARPAPPPTLNTWKSLIGKGFVRWTGNAVEDCGVILSDLGDGFYLTELHDYERPARYSDGRRIFHKRDMIEGPDGSCWFFAEDLAEAREIARGFKKPEPPVRPSVYDDEDEADASLADTEAPPEANMDVPEVDEDGTPLEAEPEPLTDIEGDLD